VLMFVRDYFATIGIILFLAGLLLLKYSKKKIVAEPADYEEIPEEIREYEFEIVDLRDQEVMTQAVPDPDYDRSAQDLEQAQLYNTRIYRYTFPVIEVTLAQESDEDPPAREIAVFGEGKLLGHVEDEDAVALRRLSRDEDAELRVIVQGGPYKVLIRQQDGAFESWQTTLEQGEEPFSGVIKVLKKVQAD